MTYTNLVLEGAGSRIVAYSGALETLSSMGQLKSIQRVGGSSAGAIISVLLALGFEPYEIKQEIENLDMTLFLDGGSCYTKNLIRLLRKLGWNPGEYFSEYMRKIIHERTGSPDTTFNDLLLHLKGRYPDPYVVISNIETRKPEICSQKHTPNLPIWIALRMSMAIPWVFTPVPYREHGLDGVYADGGITSNYPIRIFDKQTYHGYTLGMVIEPMDQIDRYSNVDYYKRCKKLKGLVDYSKRVLKSASSYRKYREYHEYERTIYIDSIGYSALDFDLTLEDKHKLMDSGKKGVYTFFSRFNGEDDEYDTE